MVRKSLSILLQVRTQLNHISCRKLYRVTAVQLMHGSSYPMVPRVLVLFVLEQYKIENLFEVSRIAEVSLWCDINEEFDLQKIFSGFCYCFLAVLSVELVLCNRSKMNYFSFTLNTLGTYFPPFSSASTLASALFAVLAVVFWDNCHVVLLEITQAAKPNLSYCWIVKYHRIFVMWIGSKILIEFPCLWSRVWRSWLHCSVFMRWIGR